MKTAPIIEIFSSLQGEGPYAGQRMTFVRFQDCDLSCRFCDTPLSFVKNRFCRVEREPFSKKFEMIPNPISVVQLHQILERFSDPTLAVTGGEPLQKVSFLKEWFPTVRPRFKILLETAGVHDRELAEVVDLVDIVSMDIKLPSSTGMRAYWEEHERFLRIALKRDVYVKVVVTEETTFDEVEKAARLVQSVAPQIPFILQPVTPCGGVHAPRKDQVDDWKKSVRSFLSSVDLIPQRHREWGVL